jgi:predicted RNase H-like HicB family nuclease
MHNYPGLGLPLRHYEQGDCEHYPIGAHSENYGAESVPLLVRELAMMDVMEKITDKQDWHTKVFDANIVSKWQKEALAVPDEELYRLATAGKTSWHVEIDGVEQLVLEDDRSVGLDQMPKGILNEQAFDSVSTYISISWLSRPLTYILQCVQELRSKAKYFEQTGIVPTLEACASVAKSDTVVTKELREALRVAFDKLRADQETSPDWHPNSGDMVQDLVHPSMYPLVYGRTRVLQEECVGVDDAIRMWAGKGTIVPKEDPEQMANLPGSLFRSVHIPPEYWSRNYQWLPANIAFQEDGSVRFTSYINNLHPNRFPGVYRTIEKLIETSLPLWDQCLAMAANYNEKTGAGRMKPRRALPDDPE